MGVKEGLVVRARELMVRVGDKEAEGGDGGGRWGGDTAFEISEISEPSMRNGGKQ